MSRLCSVLVLATLVGVGVALPDEAESAPQKRPFAGSSFWNAPLKRSAKLDPRSRVWAKELHRQVLWAQPWINTTQFSTPVYEVGRRERRVRVKLDTNAAGLQRAFDRVPIPRHARAATGSDGHMVVWQRSTDTMWEFWKAVRRADGWHARWGGKMRKVSRNAGVFKDPPDWGATATGLPLLGGLMRLRELRAGRIDHALALAIPKARSRWLTWPAQRTDGADPSPAGIPEGARFRIDPRVDLDRMKMSPLVRTMARAAQRYGVVVRDQSGAVAFFGEDPTPTGRNPYWGASGYFGGYINNVLKSQFPWRHLQALDADQRCCWKRY